MIRYLKVVLAAIVIMTVGLAFAGTDPRAGTKAGKTPKVTKLASNGGTTTPNKAIDLSFPHYTNSPPLRKFVDSLPGFGIANANNLGQFIPVAVPDQTTYADADYYEIGVVEYGMQMHSDLVDPLTGNPVLTKLRGYVQLNAPAGDVTGAGETQYLGPAIVAQRDRPVRIKVVNMLPTGPAGDLFIPVDPTVMGAGLGPFGMNPPMGDPEYSQNRAVIHLHGGYTPWISDGTPHQWTVPAGEVTAYPKGVSARDVPDMPPTGPGELTLYYPNQQSSRLQFYHDHVWGLTRLNVYAGMAAPYIITDATEQQLIANGVLPADEIPLVIQDKSFVPDQATLDAEDPTWDPLKWGGFGNLWYPHVYVPNQDPAAPDGMNPLGRWDYGPWIWPPAPAANPVLPDVSMTMESYMDTPVINGTAYPYVEVEPKAYRLRILNAANDRFFNLQLYVADPNQMGPNGTLTEVALIADCNANGNIPDPAYAGPNMVQIGNEGGVLPNPVVLTNQPIVWDTDPKSMTVGNVQSGNLILGCAERADVIVDFSAYAGQTLILYNDAPAAFPAPDPRYDYYTGAPDMTAAGGAEPTQAGYGPNTRTLMQIRVAPAPVAAPYDFAQLDTAIPAWYAAEQDPPVVMQPEYNNAYPDRAVAAATYPRIHDTSINIDGVDYQFESKAIAEEFEPVFGRMSGMLGTEWWFINNQGQQTNGFMYPDPPTEIIADGETQIWKITHNGVDTHPLHIHLFNWQVIARVDWAGVIKAPDPNELGWKETVRVSPLEDTYVAVRSSAPVLPFEVPVSVRMLNPAMPAGSSMGFTDPWPYTGQPTVNEERYFGWEYVWHCHILSHEEMDMMRPIVFNVGAPPEMPPADPSNLNAVAADPPLVVNLDWVDNAANEFGFKLERAQDVDFTQAVATFTVVGVDSTTFTDITVLPNTTYYYRVAAYNAAGNSGWSPSVIVTTPDVIAVPAAPSSLIATTQPMSDLPPQVDLTWIDNAANEDFYVLERATDAAFTLGLTTFSLPANTQQFVDDTVVTHTTYYYRVYATNAAGASGFSNDVAVTTNGWLPAAPTELTLVESGVGFVRLSWFDNSVNESNFQLQSRIRPQNNWRGTGGIQADITTTILDGLLSGRTYEFRIRARNADGTSAWSNILVVDVP